jgi:hypothetical protein
MLPDAIPKPASSLVQLEVLKAMMSGFPIGFAVSKRDLAGCQWEVELSGQEPSVWPKRSQKRLALGADASLMPGLGRNRETS